MCFINTLRYLLYISTDRSIHVSYSNSNWPSSVSMCCCHRCLVAMSSLKFIDKLYLICSYVLVVCIMTFISFPLLRPLKVKNIKQPSVKRFDKKTIKFRFYFFSLPPTLRYLICYFIFIYLETVNFNTLFLCQMVPYRGWRL